MAGSDLIGDGSMAVYLLPEPNDDRAETEASMDEVVSSLEAVGVTPAEIGRAMWTEITPFLRVFDDVTHAILPVVGTVLGAWLTSRNGRKVRLQVGEVNAEANSVVEIQELLDRASSFKRANEPKRIHER